MRCITSANSPSLAPSPMRQILTQLCYTQHFALHNTHVTTHCITPCFSALLPNVQYMPPFWPHINKQSVLKSSFLMLKSLIPGTLKYRGHVRVFHHHHHYFLSLKTQPHVFRTINHRLSRPFYEIPKLKHRQLAEKWAFGRFPPPSTTLLQEKIGDIVERHLDTLDEHLSRYHLVAATEAALDHLLFMTATFFDDVE